MNSTPKQTYSAEALPGDEWETRRSKQIVRAINRVRRERKLKTEELAARCAKFLGVPEFGTSTLNGLFAGKRKTLSVPEVEMYAAALRVSTSALLFPVGEDVEIRPGVFVPSSDALLLAEVWPNGDREALPTDSRTGTLIDIVSRASEVARQTVTAIAEKKLDNPEPAHLKLQLERLKSSVLNLQSRYKMAEEAGDAPDLAPTASWALIVDWTDIDESYLDRLEPLFENWEVEVSDDREERRAAGKGPTYITSVRITRKYTYDDE